MGGKGLLNESVNELMTELFVEQPLALPGSANYSMTELEPYNLKVGVDCYIGISMYYKVSVVKGLLIICFCE